MPVWSGSNFSFSCPGFESLPKCTNSLPWRGKSHSNSTMCRFFFPSLASPRVKSLTKCQPLERIEPRTSWNKSCAGGPRPLSSYNGPQRTRIVSDKREKLFFAVFGQLTFLVATILFFFWFFIEMQKFARTSWTKSRSGLIKLKKFNHRDLCLHIDGVLGKIS